MEINISGNAIIHDSAIGTNNEIINITDCSEINWERLQTDFLMALKLLPPESEEYRGSSQVLSSILKKSKNELVKSVKEFTTTFSSALFANTASHFLINFINSIH